MRRRSFLPRIGHQIVEMPDPGQYGYDRSQDCAFPLYTSDGQQERRDPRCIAWQSTVGALILFPF
jgi:hypothetical protein